MYASENFKIFNENAYFILVILMLFKKKNFLRIERNTFQRIELLFLKKTFIFKIEQFLF